MLKSKKNTLRQDADDISLPKRFEKQIEFIQSRKFDIVVSRAKKLHDESIILNSVLSFHQRY